MSTTPRVVFITGASAGIGLITAKIFYKNGWNVVATMRSPEKDTELKALDPTATGDRILVAKLDVTNQASIDSSINAAIEKFGKVDVLINNAGYGQLGPFEAIPRENVIDNFNVNVFGLMDVTRAALPHLRANPNGAGIINISSGGGSFAFPLISIYTSTKYALEGFSESLFYELDAQNIFVKVVCPSGNIASSYMDTAMSKYPSNIPSGYHPFMEKTTKAYDKLAIDIAFPAEDVGMKIYEAATDGKDTFRYFITPDYNFFDAKYKSGSDEKYIEYMRSVFRA